ncbi:MAG: hypothetical protein ACLFVJ_07365 [Persicimonas sp.]
MKRILEIPVDDERTIHMKRRFPASALSRLDERAPRLVEQLTDVVLSEARRAEIEGKLDAAQSARSANVATVMASFEIARTTVRELGALHEFCCTLTAKVEGFEDFEGDPVVWKDKDAAARVDLYDCEVPNTTKVMMYLFAYLIKNGIDPEAAQERGRQVNAADAPADDGEEPDDG